MDIHDFLAAKAFLVLFFSCLPKVLDTETFMFLGKQKRWQTWHLQPSFLALRTWYCGFHRRRAVTGRPPVSSSTSAPWFWECSWSWSGNFFVRKTVISHVGFSVWVMAAQLCQLEVPAKPRSALQSSLESQNCKNSLEDPGRSGPHTIDCGKKESKHSKLFRFHQLRPNDFDIKCLGCMDEILKLCQGEQPTTTDNRKWMKSWRLQTSANDLDNRFKIFVFLKLWLLWHGKKFYCDGCWHVDIPWSFCFAIGEVECLNGHSPGLYSLLVSIVKRCGTWKNLKFGKNCRRSGTWSGNLLVMMLQNCRKTLWSTGTWRKRRSTENREWARLLWFLLSFPLLRAFMKCTDVQVTADDKRLTRAFFRDNSRIEVSLGWSANHGWYQPQGQQWQYLLSILCKGSAGIGANAQLVKNRVWSTWSNETYKTVLSWFFVNFAPAISSTRSKG